MQKKFIKLLKKLRRRYIERHDLPQPRPLNKEMDPDIISSHIREKLLSPEPWHALKIWCCRNRMCSQLLRHLSSKKKNYQIHQRGGISLVVGRRNNVPDEE